MQEDWLLSLTAFEVSDMPEVSVVMGVFNGAAEIAATINSILGQKGVDFELIVVNDGSEDDTAALLDGWAATERGLRIIHKPNEGLTQALVDGCHLANGRFIARQDCGDISLQGRLARQRECLQNKPGTVFASTWAEVVGPRNEYLYASCPDEESLNNHLSSTTPDKLSGPSHHGSVMIRRDIYELVGGYRAAFYFAQDLDLWTRLIEKGGHCVLQEVLYRARLLPQSISGRHAADQRTLANLIAKASKARRHGEDEAPYLEAASRLRPQRGVGLSRRSLADGQYFIGTCLAHSDPAGARRYFRETLRSNPRHWKAWLRLAGFRRRPGGSL